MDCSKSWYGYGLAVVSGLFVLETFTIAVYCVMRHAGIKRKHRYQPKHHGEGLTENISPKNESPIEPHATVSIPRAVSVNSETVEETPNLKENGLTGSQKDHIQQNGISNGTTIIQITEQCVQKSSNPLQSSNMTEENQQRPIQQTSLNLITAKKGRTDKQKSPKHQRIDPHHRSKQRTDIIRMNTVSTDEEREEGETVKKKSVKRKSDKVGKGTPTHAASVKSRGANKKEIKSPTESQKGIMKLNQDSMDVNDGINGIKEDFDRNISEKHKNIVKSNKKSVRFDLERPVVKEIEVKNKDVLSSDKKSRISIISANKLDSNVGLQDILMGYAIKGEDGVDSVNTEAIEKRKFIVISDEEDEPAIVEIETKGRKNSQTAPEKKANKPSIEVSQESKKESQNDKMNHQHDSTDNRQSDSKPSTQHTTPDNQQPQDNNTNPKNGSLHQDRNGNFQKDSNPSTESNTDIHPNANTVSLQNGIKPPPSQHHDSKNSPPHQTKSGDKRTTQGNILASPQSVVLVEKDDKVTSSRDNDIKATGKTAKISNSISDNATENSKRNKSQYNADNDRKSSADTADKNARKSNVIIIPLENDDDGITQSKNNIARGHVNSMIKMFQNIDGGKELSEEFNC